MIQLFKILNGIDDIQPESMFTFSTSTTRGHSKKLFKPRSVKGFRQHSFCVRCIDPWNSLPSKVVKSESVTEFKNQLDIFWKHQQYDVSEVY